MAVMTRLTAQLDLDVLIAIREAAEDAPSRMRREAGIVARGPEAQATVRDLSVEPRPAVKTKRGKNGQLVRDWESNKQRRAVMAKLKGKLPWQRQHKVSRGWRSVLEVLAEGDRGGFITFENSEGATEFVQGERQQRAHAQTGWPLARLVIRNHEEALQNELIDAWARALGVK
jgi:hypothetical protein